MDTKKKILIAEDDKAIVEVIKTILETEGYTVLIAKDGQAIQTVMNQTMPHLMLLDIWLSGYDGGKIAKYLKQNEQTKHIPIILMSANNETEKVAKASGADGFLQKPFDIDELFAIVRKHCDLL